MPRTTLRLLLDRCARSCMHRLHIAVHLLGAVLLPPAFGDHASTKAAVRIRAPRDRT